MPGATSARKFRPFRYVLNDSLSCAGDVARLSFISLVPLSIPLVFRSTLMWPSLRHPARTKGNAHAQPTQRGFNDDPCGFAAVCAAELVKQNTMPD
jgi:hypothetical protein